MSEYYLKTENINDWVRELKAGDRVYLTGTLFTARDAAHKRIVSLIDRREKLPFELNGALIYYAGPTPAKNGLAIGSIGPTTSSRMDVFAPLLIKNGLRAMIGKGGRSVDVINAMIDFGAVYFAAVGGAGALYSESVKKCEVIAFSELGCESVKKLTVENFPVTVAIDSFGNNLYDRQV